MISSNTPFHERAILLSVAPWPPFELRCFFLADDGEGQFSLNEPPPPAKSASAAGAAPSGRTLCRCPLHPLKSAVVHTFCTPRQVDAPGAHSLFGVALCPCDLFVLCPFGWGRCGVVHGRYIWWVVGWRLSLAGQMLVRRGQFCDFAPIVAEACRA